MLAAAEVQGDVVYTVSRRVTKEEPAHFRERVLLLDMVGTVAITVFRNFHLNSLAIFGF